jgi:hypothetical protein
MAELSIGIEQEAVWACIRDLFVSDPNLAQEVFDLFFGQSARYEPASLVDYLFIPASAPASGTEHQVVGFRLRNADERQAALPTLKRKQVVFDRHGATLPVATALSRL